MTVVPGAEGEGKKWKPYQQAVLASQFATDELARYSDGTVLYKFTQEHLLSSNRCQVHLKYRSKVLSVALIRKSG